MRISWVCPLATASAAHTLASSSNSSFVVVPGATRMAGPAIPPILCREASISCGDMPVTVASGLYCS